MQTKSSYTTSEDNTWINATKLAPCTCLSKLGNKQPLQKQLYDCVHVPNSILLCRVTADPEIFASYLEAHWQCWFCTYKERNGKMFNRHTKFGLQRKKLATLGSSVVVRRLDLKLRTELQLQAPDVVLTSLQTAIITVWSECVCDLLGITGNGHRVQKRCHQLSEASYLLCSMVQRRRPLATTCSIRCKFLMYTLHAISAPCNHDMQLLWGPWHHVHSVLLLAVLLPQRAHIHIQHAAIRSNILLCTFHAKACRAYACSTSQCPDLAEPVVSMLKAYLSFMHNGLNQLGRMFLRCM